MTNTAYSAAIVGQSNDLNAKNYAVVTVTRGIHGYRLPSREELYFKVYADAQRQAEAMNDEAGIDRKEAALLAISCFQRGY